MHLCVTNVYVIPGLISKVMIGRAVTQAVSHWLPTASARVRVRAACGVCDGQSGTGAGFLRVSRFLLPIVIPPIFLHHNHPRLMTAVPSGPNWTSPHYTNFKKCYEIDTYGFCSLA
jgi:hypothetical protein